MTEFIKTSDVIYIAASDSAQSDKDIADYVCGGINDQDTVQQAVDYASEREGTEVRGIRIILLPGNYYISAFPRKNANGRAAVLIRSATNRFSHIGILISGSEHTESTVINITEECYNSVSDTESCSLFAVESANWNHHVFRDLYVTVPDDQKNIVCFDGRLMGSMGLRRCKCICLTKGNYGLPKKRLPVNGFIAFMGTYGSNNLWEEKWEYCQAEGFGQGFAVGSEHLQINKCGALFGRYGYTFNNYQCESGAVVHPLTLTGCADEANANLWYFGKNKYRQCVIAKEITFEVIGHWFELGGHYATEENAGDYCGHIDFVGNGGFYSVNDVSQRFWEYGSGINFETVNAAHKTVCSSAERKSYAANLGQRIFDTSLNKLLICTDPEKKIWVDADGCAAD